jgi:hypothetical protein
VTPIFALISHSKLLRPRDLYYLAQALEQNGLDVALAWSMRQPRVVVADKESKLPEWCNPIVFVDGTFDSTTLGEHYYDPVRKGPAARVFVDTSSGFDTGQNSVVETAGHELAEAMVDPQANRWVDHPTRPGIQVALEISDMVQDTYQATIGGRTWPLANFVTPEWFRGDLNDPERIARVRRSGGSFDHHGTVWRPGEIGPAGYAILRKGSEVWLENAGGRFEPGQWDAKKLESKRHPLARTARRGIQFGP